MKIIKEKESMHLVVYHFKINSLIYSILLILIKHTFLYFYIDDLLYFTIKNKITFISLEWLYISKLQLDNN
jgi:hypothetical protein